VIDRNRQKTKSQPTTVVMSDLPDAGEQTVDAYRVVMREAFG